MLAAIGVILGAGLTLLFISFWFLSIHSYFRIKLSIPEISENAILKLDKIGLISISIYCILHIYTFGIFCYQIYNNGLLQISTFILEKIYNRNYLMFNNDPIHIAAKYEMILWLYSTMLYDWIRILLIFSERNEEEKQFSIRFFVFNIIITLLNAIIILTNFISFIANLISHNIIIYITQGIGVIMIIASIIIYYVDIKREYIEFSQFVRIGIIPIPMFLVKKLYFHQYLPLVWLITHCIIAILILSVRLLPFQIISNNMFRISFFLNWLLFIFDSFTILSMIRLYRSNQKLDKNSDQNDIKASSVSTKTSKPKEEVWDDTTLFVTQGARTNTNAAVTERQKSFFSQFKHLDKERSNSNSPTRLKENELNRKTTSVKKTYSKSLLKNSSDSQRSLSETIFRFIGMRPAYC